MGLSAQRLYDRGVEHGNAGRNAAARRDLRSALARTDDPDLRARVLGTLAYIEARTGDPAAAERLCVEGLADPRVGAPTRAVLDGQLGVLALMSGQNQRARTLLTRALENAGDDPTSGRMRINRSVAAMQLGDLAQARSDLLLAAATFERAGDDVERAKALHNLGYAELLAGDLVQALGHMATARPALESLSAVAAAQCDVDRADVLRDAGLTTDAERILERVARTFGAHGMTQARAESELSLARSLLSHDPPAAARAARQAARRFRAIRSATWALRADAVRTRADLVTEVYGRRGERRPTASRSTVDADAAEELASALSRAGFALEAMSVRLAAALRFAGLGSSVVTPRVPATAPTGPRLMLHQLRARRAELRGSGAEVRRHCARGLDELLSRQASFGSLDLQTSAAMNAVPLAVTGLSSALASGRPEIVFEWSERARHLSQAVVPLRPPPDPLLAADLAELRRLRGDGSDEHWLADPRAAALRDRIRDRQWSGVGAREVQDRADLAALRAGLDGETALLAYVWAGDRLACVVATAERAEVVPLPPWPDVRALIAGLRADLDVSASVTTGPLADVVRRSRDERLAALSDALLERPAARCGARRFVITAPGVLNGLPWGMLPAMNRHPFTLAPSASRWLAMRGEAPRPALAGFVAGPRVARAAEEVERASGAWGGGLALAGAQATVAAVTGLAGTVDVLHIAAHGRHAVDNPLFSGLELVDGTLFGYDIDLMPVVPKTVVLSACEVGRSSVRWGEEAIGMTRGWLHAGTRSVVAAPVIVADDAACELLTAVHEGMAAGETPSEALARAAEDTGIIAPFQVHGSGF